MESTPYFVSKWLPKRYVETFVSSHPKFLPELVETMILWIYQGSWSWREDKWETEDRTITQSTLAACCLVSQEWNRICTPVLYSDIFLGKKNSLLTRSLLYRTLQHTRLDRKALVRTMTIEPAEDGSTSNLLSICFAIPNLRNLILKFTMFDLSALHPEFAQQLRSLSRCCTVQMVDSPTGNVKISWESLPVGINFIRRSKSTSCVFSKPLSDRK